jgi:hypothetical protein
VFGGFKSKIVLVEFPTERERNHGWTRMGGRIITAESAEKESAVRMIEDRIRSI